MKICGLYGKSGTGKSYHAMSLAARIGAEALIDDGLLIADNQVLAGISAKKEVTKVGAIKTALFTKEEHAQEVRGKIRELNPSAILILGTSVDMIKRIAERLELPEPEQMISIESISSEWEMAHAQRMRKERGTHVIPAPTLQVKRQFSGFFIDPLSFFRDRPVVPFWNKNRPERTIVRPTYSYLGEFRIGDNAIRDIVLYVGRHCANIEKVSRVLIDTGEEDVEISVTCICTKGSSIPETVRVLQTAIHNEVENMTAFNIRGVNVDVRNIQ